MDFLEEEHIYEEDKNKRTGLWISITLHVLLLLLCLAPFFSILVPEENFQGILVDIGMPDDGGGDETKEAQITDPDQEETEPSSSETEPAPEVTEKKVPDAKPSAKEKVVTIPVDTKESNIPDAVIAAGPASGQNTDADKKAREKAAADAAAEAAAEEARKQKEYEEKKKKYGDLFGKGQGKENGGGDQGDPTGDPDAKVLEGTTTGAGKIGGGIADRGLVFEPVINDNSQKAGVVVVKVCVDNSGKVISSRFTQRGSTTTDRTLVDVAEKAAAQYVFSSSQVDKQCGTITIDFKLK